MKNMIKSSHFWRVWLPPHLFAAIGLWFYASWQVLAVALVCYTLISGLGVAVGFHRYFSHKAFRASPFWQQQMLFWGSLACHGNPLFWVALHRGLHHRYSDTEKDPHSPVAHSLWHSYQGYAFDPKLVHCPHPFRVTQEVCTRTHRNLVNQLRIERITLIRTPQRMRNWRVWVFLGVRIAMMQTTVQRHPEQRITMARQ
jgi:fatty-acid desaturase